MTPAVSVFTPSHDPRWLDDCWTSLAAQTFTDFEWLVLLNGGARWTPPDTDRTRVIQATDIAGVGAAKAAAVAHCRGDLLVELDHDDLLAPTALEAVVKAHADRPDAALLYTDCCEIDADGNPRHPGYDESAGWTYYGCTVNGQPLLAIASKPPTPHNVSYIWYAPNHLRAFPRTAYDAAGGYDPDRDICDDADLLCRLYQQGPFVHLPEPLYVQRMHGGNTQWEPDRNTAIQAETLALYDRHVEKNALAWAAREGLRAVDLGGAHGKPDGYLSLDRTGDVDITCDVRGGLPFDDATVGVLRAVDFLEHVPDVPALMAEAARVLAPGGMFLTLTPSTDGRGAFCDPTHVSFLNELSFRYYTDPQFAAYIGGPVLFTTSRLVTYFPTDWHRDNQVPYVCWNGTR